MDLKGKLFMLKLNSINLNNILQLDNNKNR